MKSIHNTANDNHPVSAQTTRAVFQGDTTGQALLLKERAYESATSQHGNHGRGKITFTKPKTGLIMRPAGLTLALGIWVISLAVCFGSIGYSASPYLRIFAGLGVVWGSLLLAFTAGRQGRFTLRDLGLSAALSGTGMALLFTATTFNIPLSPSIILSSGAIVTALLAGLLRAPLFMTLSCLFAILWTLDCGLDLQISSMAWIFPALWAVQMFLSTEAQAKLPIVLATISGLFWLGTNLFVLTLTGQISALMAVSGLAIFGIMHSRIGKSMQDVRAYSGLFQTNIGWVVAIAAAITLQDYWLSGMPHATWNLFPDLAFTAAPMMGAWSAVIAACIVLVGGCSILRTKLGKQTLLGGLGILGFAALLPAITAFTPQIGAILESKDLSPAPLIGLIIGSAVTAFSLGMLINGLRRGKTSMILMAFTALALEAIIVMESLYDNPENLTIFGFAVLISALTVGVYAHKGFERGRERKVGAHYA